MTQPVDESAATREERDSLGTFTVPAEALYGVQTARAVDNFPISGLRAWPALVEAIVTVKKAAALANRDLGRLPGDKADAIVRAADEVLAGRHRDQFVVDVYQAGAGTSFNMNANEVLANRANELLGAPRGDYKAGVHPNDDVNMAQSTNDVFPTAMRLAGLALAGPLKAEVERLAQAFEAKGREFDGILKSGRTHLQDAVPIRLGQEFAAYGKTLRKAALRIGQVSDGLAEARHRRHGHGHGPERRPRVPPPRRPATARGDRPPGPAGRRPGRGCRARWPWPSSLRPCARSASRLTRIANDLRLLASGPRTGLAEIRLPPVSRGPRSCPARSTP